VREGKRNLIYIWRVFTGKNNSITSTTGGDGMEAIKDIFFMVLLMVMFWAMLWMT